MPTLTEVLAALPQSTAPEDIIAMDGIPVLVDPAALTLDGSGYVKAFVGASPPADTTSMWIDTSGPDPALNFFLAGSWTALVGAASALATLAEAAAGTLTTKGTTPAQMAELLPTVPLHRFAPGGILPMDDSVDIAPIIETASWELVGEGKGLYIPFGIGRWASDIVVPPDIQWHGPGGNRYKTGAGGVSFRYYGEGTALTIDGTTGTLTDNIQGMIAGVRFSYAGAVGDATTAKHIVVKKCADFLFKNVYNLNAGTGYDVESTCSALRHEGCYTSGKLYGMKGVGASDCRLSDSQYSGGVYGLWMESCPSLQLRGVRPQVSGTCGIFLDRCAHLSWVGGIDDSATLKPSGSREGARLKDCRVGSVVGVPFYSNFSHLVIENTGEDFTGTYALSIIGNSFEGNDSIRIEQHGGKAKRVTIVGNSTTSSIATLLEIEEPTGGASPIEELVIVGNTGAGLGIYGIQHAHQDTLVVGPGANTYAWDNGIARAQGRMFTPPFHIELPDVSGTRFSQESATAPMHPGDISGEVIVASDVWTMPASTRRTIASQYTSAGGNNRSWSFDQRVISGSGPHSLSFAWSPDGTSGAVIQKNMDGTILDMVTGATIADGGFARLGWSHDVDDGAGGNVIKFWTWNGSAWVQFGTTITTAGTTSHGGTSAELALGGIVGGTSQRFIGKIRSLKTYTGFGASGIPGGTLTAEWTACVPQLTYRDHFNGLWERRGSAFHNGVSVVAGSLPAVPYSSKATALAGLVAVEAMTPKTTADVLEQRPAMVFPGTSGNYYSTSGVSIGLTDFTVVAYGVKPATWRPATAQTIWCQYITSGNNRKIALQILADGQLRIVQSSDGTALGNVDSVEAMPNDGRERSIAITRDGDDGTGQRIYRYVVSYDGGVTWVKWAERSGSTTTLFNATAPIQVGGLNNNTSTPFIGTIAGLSVRSDIGRNGYPGATEVAEVSGYTFPYVDAYGNTWALAGSATSAVRLPSVRRAAVPKKRWHVEEFISGGNLTKDDDWGSTLQAGLDHVQEIHGTLELPPFAVFTTVSLNVSDGCGFIGEEGSFASRIIAATTLNDWIVKVQGVGGSGFVQGFKMRDIFLDGNGRASNAGGLYLKQVQRSVIRDVVTRYLPRGSMFMQSFRNSRVYDVWSRHNADVDQGFADFTLYEPASGSPDRCNLLAFYGIESIYPYGRNIVARSDNNSLPIYGTWWFNPQFHGETNTTPNTVDGYTFASSASQFAIGVVLQGVQSFRMFGPYWEIGKHGTPYLRTDDNGTGSASNSSIVIDGPQFGNTSHLSVALTSVDTATDRITISGGADLPQVAMVRFTTTGTLPGGLSLATDYFLRRISNTQWTVHSTSYRAENNTNVIDITSVGSGTHTVVTQEAAILLYRAAGIRVINKSRTGSGTTPNRPLVVDKHGATVGFSGESAAAALANNPTTDPADALYEGPSATTGDEGIYYSA